MARQRDYAAEYARRDPAKIKAQRETHAAELGFPTYGKYRSSADKIAREFKSLQKREIWELPLPIEGTPLWKDMMKADAILKGYSPAMKRQADKRQESLLGRTQKGRAVRDRLRAALGWKEGEGWGRIYFPAMRALY